MTVFHHSAEILSSHITTGIQMRNLALPGQGSTNTPAGVEKAVRVIHGQEMKSKAKGKLVKTHHILILLSDGEHNHGEDPGRVF
jgi:hypothetical protein